MYIGRPHGARRLDGDGLVDGGQQVEARGHGGGVNEGVLKVWVPAQQLRLQKLGVGDVAEEGHVHRVRAGNMLEGDSFEHGDGDDGDDSEVLFLDERICSEITGVRGVWFYG